MSIHNGPGEGTWSVFAEQAVKERDEARAQMVAAIGALQELSQDPDVAGVPLYILQAPDKPLIVEPRIVKSIFYALEKHAKILLPFGKAALDKAYKYDALCTTAREQQDEIRKLRLMIAPLAKADARVDYTTIAEITRKQAEAQASTAFDNTKLRAVVEQMKETLKAIGSKLNYAVKEHGVSDKNVLESANLANIAAFKAEPKEEE